MNSYNWHRNAKVVLPDWNEKGEAENNNNREREREEEDQLKVTQTTQKRLIHHFVCIYTHFADVDGKKRLSIQVFMGNSLPQ